ncbi:MAG: AAA family ATPase [bacterium]|nr:AAA family ATPase [bacterium]
MPTLGFDDFEIDLDLFTLTRGGVQLEIGARPLNALIYLIENRHRIVNRETLRERIWKGAEVSASTIPTCIMSIRQVLTDDPKNPRYITSHRTRGYRFIGAVRGIGLATVADTRAQLERIPFVGREAEMSRLHAAWRKVRVSGIGRLVLVSAEAGMGKSRLLEEFSATASVETPTYSTRAAPSEGALPFLPWANLLRKAVADSSSGSDVERFARALGDDIPELGLRPSEDAGADRTRRVNSFRRWTSAICALSERGPAVLLIDDIHRLDHDSLLLLYWIADELDRTPLFVIATTRPRPASQATSDLIADIADLQLCSQLSVSPLEPPDVETLLDPLGDDIPSVAKSLVAQTNGNAFYVTHLIRSLSALSSSSNRGFSLDGLPLHAREIVARQLSDLPRLTRTALEAASVLGDRFGPEALCKTAGFDLADALDYLQPAVDAWILREQSGTFMFNHSILRESLYRTFPPLDRRRAHLRYAEHLKGAPSSNPIAAEVAHHLTQALPVGDAAEAMEATLQAAAQASQRHAYSESKRLLEQAVEIHDRNHLPQEPRERVGLLIELAQATLYCGDRESARAILLDAADIARSAGDSKAIATCALSLAPDFLTIEFGVQDTALIRLIEESLECLDPDDEETRALLQARLSLATQWSQAPPARDELAASALSAARKTGSRHAEIGALAALAETLNGPSNASRRLRTCNELEKLSIDVGDIPSTLLCHTRKIAALLEIGDISSIRTENALHRELASRYQLPQYGWLSIAIDSMLSALAGDLRQAELLASEYVLVAKNNHDMNVFLTFAGQRASWQLERDQPELIVPVVRSLSAAQPTVMFWKALLIWSLALSGSGAEAHGQLEAFDSECMRRLSSEPGGGLGIAVLGEAAATCGSPQVRSRLIDHLEPLSEHSASAGYGVTYFGSFARYLGALLREQQDFRRARMYLQNAVTEERERYAPSWHMYALAELLKNEIAAGADFSELAEQARAVLCEYDRLALPRAKRLLGTALQIAA